MSSLDSAASGPTAGRGLPRLFDVGVSFLGLLVLAPVLLGLALLVRVGSQGPALFRQARIGREGKTFELLKFRSMRVGEPGPEVTAAGDSRVTGVGRWLRRFKLDELPELWNVARGDMALVGPRPEVPAYVDLENPSWQRVLSVCPGLTDPVTIELRNEEELLAGVEHPETFYQQVLQPYKLASYEKYLDERTAWSDLKVLGQTLMAVLRPTQASPPSIEELHARVEENHGTQT